MFLSIVKLFQLSLITLICWIFEQVDYGISDVYESLLANFSYIQENFFKFILIAYPMAWCDSSYS